MPLVKSKIKKLIYQSVDGFERKCGITIIKIHKFRYENHYIYMITINNWRVWCLIISIGKCL